MDSLLLLEHLKLETISLLNITIEEGTLETFIQLLLAPNIKNLKLVLTDRIRLNPNFQIAANSALARLTEESMVENLMFTLEQDLNSDQQLITLIRPKQLKQLVIYYSAQYSLFRLYDLLSILRSRPSLQLTFIEYLILPIAPIKIEYAKKIVETSLQAKRIIEATKLDPSIVAIDHSAHFPLIKPD